MPRMDKTGPMGQGAGTGRGLSGCIGDVQPAFAGRGMRGGYRGRGMRCGGGRGYGMGAGFYADETTKKDFLTQEQAFLQNRLDFISKELDNISKAD